MPLIDYRYSVLQYLLYVCSNYKHDSMVFIFIVIFNKHDYQSKLQLHNFQLD